MKEFFEQLSSKRVIKEDLLNEQAMSKNEAIDRCQELGVRFIEHFEKCYDNPSASAVHHWLSEMQAWFNKVSKTKIKQTNKFIRDGQLRDWFFTACALPEDYMNSLNEDKLEAYDKFCTLLLANSNCEESFNTIIER